MCFSDFEILLFFTQLTLILSGGKEKKKTLLGNSHEQAFEPKFVPQGDVEERTAVAHHRRTLWA